MTNNYVDRKVLEDWGFISATSEDGREWTILRYWKKPGPGKARSVRQIKVRTAICKHPYGTDKGYPTITFSVDSKARSMTLARFLHAWFVGPVNSDMDVDHIDNDPFNNEIGNLRLVTRGENIRKRFMDSDCNVNQFGRRKAIEVDAGLPRDYYVGVLGTLEGLIDATGGEEDRKRLRKAARMVRGMIAYWDRAHGQERID